MFLPSASLRSFVATRVREAAHRFAITHDRSLRERTIRESVLDEVQGIGPAKKTALLRRFHSIYGIARASDEEIAAVAGVGPDIAAAVKRAALANAGAMSKAPVNNETGGK